MKNTNTVLSAMVCVSRKRDFRHDFKLTVSKKRFWVRFISGLQNGDVVFTYSHQIKIKQRRHWWQVHYNKKSVVTQSNKKSKRKLIENCATHDS